MQVKCFDSSAGRYHFVLEGIVTSSHAHPVAEVILAREGTFDLSLGEQLLSGLRFAIICPNEIHRLSAEACMLEILMLESYNDTLEQYLQSSGMSPTGGCWLLPKGKDAAEAFASLLAFAESVDLRSVSDSRVSQSIALLAEENTSYQERFEALREAIPLSASRLSHLFKEHIGLSLKKYLLWCRLRQAISLFLEGEDKLFEVAHRSGFYDQAHLSRAFTTILGISPSQVYNSRTIQF